MDAEKIKEVNLTPEEKEQLNNLVENDWVQEGISIQKKFTFKNFNQAFGFMSRIAMASEKADHHPDWTNSYNKVDISWTTHCSKALTKKDLKMAKFCDDIFKKM